jgi:restriction system protein
MAIPDYQTFMRPLLEYGADEQEKNIREAIAFLSDQFELSPEDRLQTIPSGKEPLVSNRIHWARTYLAKAGALARTRRSHFKATERGLDLLRRYPDRVDVKVLEQFPEFIAFRAGKSQGDEQAKHESEKAASPNTTETKTPDEIISASLAEINQRLENDLLERISEQTPTFFEAPVVDLIVEMGYGGSRENVVQRIGKMSCCRF